jgi:hypothetical protein
MDGDVTEIPVLAPLVVRELCFRLLQGEQQGRLAEIAIGDGRLRRVAVHAHFRGRGGRESDPVPKAAAARGSA